MRSLRGECRIVKLIAGLGNPGPKYAESRHNIGFMVVDALARSWQTRVDRYDRDYEALVGEGVCGGQRVLLVKPTTYMNLSGRSVAAVMRFYKLTAADVLVVLDDMDLEPGRLRLRARGSAGGHNGLTDVIRHLSTEDVARLRIGIGRVHGNATVDYVLSRFRPDERLALEEALSQATAACTTWVTRGIEAAMNEFNRRRDDGGRPPEGTGQA